MPTLTDNRYWSKVVMVYDIGKIKTLENKYHQYTWPFNTKSNNILRFMFPDNISTVFCTSESPQILITLIRMLNRY